MAALIYIVLTGCICTLVFPFVFFLLENEGRGIPIGEIAVIWVIAILVLAGCLGYLQAHALWPFRQSRPPPE